MTQNKQTLLDEKQTPEGYKKTEFGNIPADWSVLCLGELGKFKNGINKDANQFGFGKPFVNLMDVFGKLSIDKTVSFELINSTELDRKEYSLNRGDVLFIRSSVKPSGVGLTAVITDNLLETVFSGFLIRFRSDGNLLDLGFKKYCFNANYFRKQVISNSTVSANTNINQEVLKKLELIFPKKLEEQQKIATALSDIDALISELEKLIEKKQAIKTATMQQLLTGKTRLPEFALREDGTPKGYKDSKLGQIPEDWLVEPLENFTSFISYGFTNPMPTTKNGPYMITAKDINGGKIQYKEARQTSIKAFNTLLSPKSKPKKNDVLLTKDGTLGRLALVEDESICINQSVAVLRPNQRIIPAFFKLLLESSYYQEQMLENAGGSTIKHIYITVVNKMLLALPHDLREQKKISSILLDLDASIHKLELDLAKVKVIKIAMMQELLTGKTRLV